MIHITQHVFCVTDIRQSKFHPRQGKNVFVLFIPPTHTHTTHTQFMVYTICWIVRNCNIQDESRFSLISLFHYFENIFTCAFECEVQNIQSRQYVALHAWHIFAKTLMEILKKKQGSRYSNGLKIRLEINFYFVIYNTLTEIMVSLDKQYNMK